MIYISGRITGNKNWKKEFNQAEKYLSARYSYKVVNPVGIAKFVEHLYSYPSYNDYMRNDIQHLMLCDKIYMLRGWQKSKGARLERKIAKAFGMKIIYQRKKECGK